MQELLRKPGFTMATHNPRVMLLDLVATSAGHMFLDTCARRYRDALCACTGPRQRSRLHGSLSRVAELGGELAQALHHMRTAVNFCRPDAPLPLPALQPLSPCGASPSCTVLHPLDGELQAEHTSVEVDGAGLGAGLMALGRAAHTCMLARASSIGRVV